MSRPSVPSSADTFDAAQAAEAIRGGVERLDRATGLLVRSESTANGLVGQVAEDFRDVAVAGDAEIPVLVQTAARNFAASHPAILEAEQIVRARSRELAARRRHAERRAALLEPTIVGAAGTATAFVVGLVVALGAGRLPGDAIARVVAAQTIVTGRDPHPESIGFIWGPFPTAFEVPLAALRSWWPALTSAGVAAVVVSSVCFGLLLAQLVIWGRDGGAPRWFRLAVVALVAAHPLLVLYGANGMSECCWLLFMVLAVRWLSRWWETDDVVSLALGGVALGAAYLTRYETVGTLAVVAVVVAAVSWRKTTRVDPTTTSKQRAWATCLDLTVVLFPAVAAVVGWAFASWAVVGQPFAQFTSQYGNSALVEASQSGNTLLVGDASAAGRLWFFLRQLMVASPAMLLLVGLGLWVGGRTARRTLVAASVVGAPVLLQALFAVQGQTFPWFRYVITAVVLSGLAAMAAGGRSHWVRTHRSARFVVVALLVPGVVLSWSTVVDGRLGADIDTVVVDGFSSVVQGRPVDRRDSEIWLAQRVARDIDGMPGVVPGAVLTDLASTSPVIGAAPRADVYVVPPDRDFLATVADPALYGVRYVLLRGPALVGDAVVRAYPALLTNTEPMARSVRTWGSPSHRAGQYQLFKISAPRGRPRATPTEEFGQ